MRYLDFYVHVTMSDGIFSPEAVIGEVKRCEIEVLAITDHNSTLNLMNLGQNNSNIFLAQGSGIIVSFIVAVMANVISNLIIKWLDRNNKSSK